MCFAPRNTSAPGSFVAPPRTSPPKKMSAPGDGHIYQVMVIIYCNIVALKTMSPNVYGQITLNNGKERIKKPLRERHTLLRNIGNQTDSDDARWIWINPTILAIQTLYGGCPCKNNVLRSTFSSMWDLHYGNYLTSFSNWDLAVYLMKRQWRYRK